MATPRKKTRKSGAVVWEMSVRKTGHPNLFASFPSREEAEEFGKEIERRIFKEQRAVADPSSTLPSSRKLEDEKLRDTIAMFLRSDSCIPRHRQLLPTILRNIGDTTIGELRPSWTAAYIQRLRKKPTRRKTLFSYETIVSQLHMINVVLKWRAEALDLPAPVFSLGKKKLPYGWANQRTRRFESGEEETLMRFIAQMPSPNRVHWGLLIRLAIETGARQQELIFAEWPEISAGLDFWTIPKDHTKCKKERVMPFTSEGVEIIRALKKLASPHSNRIFHALGTPASVSTLFHRWSKASGLNDFRFHDLRHEAISRFVLTQRNFSVHEVMQMVGHSSPAMLARYSNLRGDELSQKIIKKTAVAPPDLLQPSTNRFAHDFITIRGQSTTAKPAAPIYGSTTGMSVYVDARRHAPPGPVA